MEQENKQAPQQPNPEYQEQFQQQADIYNEQEQLDYQNDLANRSLAEKFMFKKPEPPVKMSAVDMAHEEALTVDSVVNKSIENGSEDTPQEIAETVLTSKEFGLKTPEELERRERLLRDGSEVVAKVYSADIDQSWVERNKAVRQMSFEDAVQMRMALRELISDYIATCIKAGDKEDLTKIALENSIDSVGGVEAYKDFPRDIIESEPFQGKMVGHIEDGTRRQGYTFESDVRSIRSRAETVASNGLMDPEALKAVIAGEVIQSFCQTGIEDGTRRQGYTFESDVRSIRSRAEIVREQQLMTDELIDRVIKSQAIQEFCQTGIEDGTRRQGYTFESDVRSIRSRAETVASNGLMDPEALKAVIAGEVIQSFCQTGIEDGTRRQGYTFESDVRSIRSRAEIVREQQLMTDELIDRVIKSQAIQEFCQTGIEDGTRRQGYSFGSNAREVRSRAETVIKQVLMDKAKADAIAQASIDSMHR